jgi:hypothetical protein
MLILIRIGGLLMLGFCLDVRDFYWMIKENVVNVGMVIMFLRLIKLF